MSLDFIALNHGRFPRGPLQERCGVPSRISIYSLIASFYSNPLFGDAPGDSIDDQRRNESRRACSEATPD